jgi:hypothetical protein
MRFFAELRAFEQSSKFAQTYNLNKLDDFAFDFSNSAQVQSPAISIADSYKSLSGITDNEIFSAIDLFTKQRSK